MKTAPLFYALLVAALALAPGGAQAAGKPAAPDQEAPPPRSVFVIDPGVGRDPFFPKSIRNPGRMTVKTNEPLEANGITKELSLPVSLPVTPQ